MPLKSFYEFYLVYNHFRLKYLRSKLQNLRKSFLDNFGSNWRFFFYLWSTPKKCFPAKFTFQTFSWTSWSYWYVLITKLIWIRERNWDLKIAILELTCFDTGFWNLQVLKLPFYRKIFKTLLSKGISGFRVFSWFFFGEGEILRKILLKHTKN